MGNLKKNQYSLRKSLTKNRSIINSTKPNQSSKVMVRTAKDEKLKAGIKRTRGRPRTKEPKISSLPKRHRLSNANSSNGMRSPQREGSLSPSHQEPPQLEPMPAVGEDDDLDIPLGYASLNSVDEHLLPGKCIVICPFSTCRKKFVNPIELVSHLRNYHEKEKLSSLKIYTCPTCLKTRFSSHTTSSDLTLLTEHAERYHGQTLEQNDFVYFCSIVMGILTDDKATQKKEENIVKKEIASAAQHQISDTLYHPLLPLVPNSNSALDNPYESNKTKVARVNADSVSLKMPPQTSHFIQISPVTQGLPNTAPTVVSSTALAAVAGHLPPGAFLLSSNSTSNPVVTTSAEHPILLAPSSNICTTPLQPLPVLITPPSVIGEANRNVSNNNNLQLPQSPGAVEAIATLKQLIQSASTTKSQQQQQFPSQTSSPITLTSTSFIPSPSTHSQMTPSSTPVPKVVTKSESSSTVPTSYSFVQGGNATVSSPGADLESSTDLSSYASASADLLTLARLSVDALNNSNFSSTNALTASSSTVNNHQIAVGKIAQENTNPLTHVPSSTTPMRNRRLLPRKTTPLSPSTVSVTPQVTQLSAGTATPIPIRKRVALPPLAVKPSKEVAQTPAASAAAGAATTLEGVAGTSGTPIGFSEEAPVMTATLISPSANASTTFIPSTHSTVLTKSRLVTNTTNTTTTTTASFINLPVRPVISAATALAAAAAAAAAVVPSSTSITNQQPTAHLPSSQHLIQRMMPTIRPAPLQKILPRPNASVAPSITPGAQSKLIVPTQISTAIPTSKDIRYPLLYSVAQAPLIGQVPVTMVTPSLAGVVVTTPSPTVVATSMRSTSQPVNGNGSVPPVASPPTATASNAVPSSPHYHQLQPKVNTSVSSDEGHLIICTSPSEMNIST